MKPYDAVWLFSISGNFEAEVPIAAEYLCKVSNKKVHGTCEVLLPGVCRKTQEWHLPTLGADGSCAGGCTTKVSTTKDKATVRSAAPRLLIKTDMCSWKS